VEALRKQRLDRQAYFRGIAVLAPDHCNEANITLKWVPELFCFLVHVKVKLTLYYSPLRVQYIMSKKENVYTLVKNCIIARFADNHLSLQKS
jgi:hypothetical protein